MQRFCLVIKIIIIVVMAANEIMEFIYFGVSGMRKTLAPEVGSEGFGVILLFEYQ